MRKYKKAINVQSEVRPEVKPGDAVVYVTDTGETKISGVQEVTRLGGVQLSSNYVRDSRWLSPAQIKEHIPRMAWRGGAVTA